MADSFEKLSGSTDGKQIKVTATAIGSGVTIHTAHATDLDLVTLFATNNDADGETRTLCIGWGGTTDPDDLVYYSIPCKAGDILLCDRKPLTNSLVVKASADEANDVQVSGFVTRIDK